MHIEATIGIIEFIEAPNKTIVNQKHCKKITLRIKGREYKIHGSSHLKFNNENRIIYHRDYWDVGEEILLNVPFIRVMYSYFRKKLALPQERLC